MDSIITTIRENLAKVRKKFLKVQEAKKKYQNTLSVALAQFMKSARDHENPNAEEKKPQSSQKVNVFLQALVAKSEQIKKEREKQE